MGNARYFSHDLNARNDPKIIKLRQSKDGLAKYGVYWMLIEKLCDTNGYTLEKDYNSLAWEFRCENSLLKSTIEEFGLFDFTEDGNCFYSDSLLRRMQLRDSKSLQAKKSAEARWDKKRTQSVNHANALRTQSDGNAIKEKKLNKKKVKIEDRKKDFASTLEPFLEKYGREMLKQFFSYWSEPNHENTELKFEMEDTWSLERRLSTWKKNEEKFNPMKPNPNYSQIPNAIV